MSINYVIGDATYPIGDGAKVIAHVVNDIGKFGSGFAYVVSKKWPVAKQAYHLWYEGKQPLAAPFELGQVLFVPVEHNVTIAHIIGQHQTIRENSKPIRYDALRKGLTIVAKFCLGSKASFNAPRLGSGLAKGDWSIIEDIIKEEILEAGVSVTIYDLS